MAGLISTTEGYLAQMIGQLVIEKANLLAELDKSASALAEERSKKDEPDPSRVPVGPDV